MAQVISTIFFNGQFWLGLIEKYEDDGHLFIGKYTFGSEPTRTDLFDFYLNKYQNIQSYQSEKTIRIKKKYSINELDKNCKKSYESFKIEQKKYLSEKKKSNRKRMKDSEKEKFIKKIKKKKCKKRGH